MVGNGSVTPPTVSRPVLPIIGRNKPKTPTVPLPRKPFQNPLRLLLNPDIVILLFFNGLICAVFYGVNASISTIFHQTYPSLSQTQLGLCYLGTLRFIFCPSASLIPDLSHRRWNAHRFGDLGKDTRLGLPASEEELLVRKDRPLERG